MALSPLTSAAGAISSATAGRYGRLIGSFSIMFAVALPAEFVANDKPIVVKYRGELYAPIFKFYPETAFGGDFQTEAIYRDPEVDCLIRSGGLGDCFDDPEGVIADARGRRLSTARRSRRAGRSGRSFPIAMTHPWTGPAPRRCRPTSRTGWAPMTPSAMCWRG